MAASAPFPFSAVIFDMDGVIVDTEALYLDELRAFFPELGIEVSEDELLSTVGGSHQSFRRQLASWIERADRAMTPDEAEAYFATWSAARSRDYGALINPGVAETIAALKARGARVALASSSPLSNIREVLAACGLADAFEIIVSGEQFRESKPNPEIYLHTLELLGLPASACCCVEDSFYGIAAGKAAGLTVFAKREERFGFSQDAADTIIDQLPDLLGAADALAAARAGR